MPAPPAKTGQDERQTHVPHVEPEVLGQPGTDPAEVAALDRALQPAHRPALTGVDRRLREARMAWARGPSSPTSGAERAWTARSQGPVRVESGATLMASAHAAAKIEDMNEQSTTDPQTGLDKVFAALRGIGVRRRTDDKWIAGVCSGLADRLGVDPVIVRAALVLLSILGGVGITVYLVAWALLPNDRDEIAAERALRDGDGGSDRAARLRGAGAVRRFLVGQGLRLGLPVGPGVHRPAHLVAGPAVAQPSRRRPTGERPTVRHPVPPRAATAHPVRHPDHRRRVAAGPPPAPYAAGHRPSPPPRSAPQPCVLRPVVPRKPRRRSGGPLMALLAIGLALVTYGSLIWLGTAFSWTGDHQAIAFAGSLAAIGLLLGGARPGRLAGRLRGLPGGRPGDHRLVEHRGTQRGSTSADGSGTRPGHPRR